MELFKEKKIAVIGTGALGSPIARCFIRAGFSLTVYDVRGEAMEPLVAMGAMRAEKVADCTDAHAIIIVVANDAQMQEVIAGAGGILNNLDQETRPDLAVISTVSPQTVRRLGLLCCEEGVGIIDAPVSGGHVAAESGNLNIMVGGSKDVFERMKPILSVIGKRLDFVGELGMGLTIKLINNIVGVTDMFLTIEALATGVRNNVPLDTLLSIMDAGSGSNFYIRNWPVTKNFFSDFAKNINSARNNLFLSIKDLTHAQALAGLENDPSPLLKGLIEALKEMTPESLVKAWSDIIVAVRADDLIKG